MKPVFYVLRPVFSAWPFQATCSRIQYTNLSCRRKSFSGFHWMQQPAAGFFDVGRTWTEKLDSECLPIPFWLVKDILVRAIAVVVVQSVQTPPFAVAYNGFSPPRHGGTCRGHVPIDVTMHFRQRLWKKPRQYSRSRYQRRSDFLEYESATRQGASDWLATASSSI